MPTDHRLLPTIREYLAERVDPDCGVCGGLGWVCEDHPDRSWETGWSTDCPCGVPGMPCACIDPAPTRR